MLRKKKILKEELVDLSHINMQVKVSDEDNRYKGSLNNYVDLIYPSGIDVMAPNYINIDGAYIASLLCYNFPYSVRQCFFDEIINFTEGVELMIRQEPANKSETIKDITHYLGYTKYKLKQGENQIDSGLQENAYSHSVYMKKRLAEGDEFWYMNVSIKITADSPEKLENKIRLVEGILAGKDIFYKRADYRQLEAFISTLPIEKMDKRIKEQTEKNILSSGLCSLYPFTSSSLSDPEGMFVGLNENDNSQVIIDIFNTENYANANMILCGGSGSGKTFTTQMLAGRFRMQKIPVMMICPLKGHEYEELCENVGGNFIRFAAGAKHKINILGIRPTKSLDNKGESLLAVKLQKMQIFFSLMFPDITERELKLFDAPLAKVYEKKGITMDNASLYINTNNDGKISLSPKLKEMPILSDVKEEIKGIPELTKYAEEMEPFITGSLSFFNGQTNVDLDNLYTVADISSIEKNNIALAMFVVLDIFWDNIKRARTQRKVIVLDELWKLIGTAGNVQAAEFVLEIWKTIRGYGGAAIGATQDISDFMMLENGKYGKGIISASKIKIVLQLEDQEAEAMANVLKLSEEELTRVTKFKKGHGLLYAGSNHLAVNFMPFESEKRLITTDRKEILKYKEEAI